jgi:lipoprotein-anchoring transpeptidase ErfK/SrfK
MACGVSSHRIVAFVLSASLACLAHGGVRAEPLAMIAPGAPPTTVFDTVLRDPPGTAAAPRSQEPRFELSPELRRQVVSYATREPPGTVIVDTANTYLYFVLGGGKAIRYGIGVGRDGFTWAGVSSVSRKAEWPDWTPPAEMIARQRYLPRWMAGGPGNPLGARALYLGASQYRIHGTNDPSTIGKRVSSGCFRLANEDVIDLYNRVRIGAKVVVLPGGARASKSAALPRPKQPEPATETSLPPPDKRSKRSLAFGLY